MSMPEPSTGSAGSKVVALTCEYCENTAATQVFSADVFKLGRHTTFCCGPCGDEQEHHVRRLNGQVWRYRISPLRESAAAGAASKVVFNIDPQTSCAHCRGACGCRRF